MQTLISQRKEDGKEEFELLPQKTNAQLAVVFLLTTSTLTSRPPSSHWEWK
jgi:hypothetical protein